MRMAFCACSCLLFASVLKLTKTQKMSNEAGELVVVKDVLNSVCQLRISAEKLKLDDLGNHVAVMHYFLLRLKWMKGTHGTS